MLRAFTAGGLATIFTKCTTAPIERVKLVIQLQNRSALAGPSTSAISQRTYNGMIDCFKSLCAEQGFASMWKGNVSQTNLEKCHVSGILFRTKICCIIGRIAGKSKILYGGESVERGAFLNLIVLCGERGQSFPITFTQLCSTRSISTHILERR